MRLRYGRDVLGLVRTQCGRGPGSFAQYNIGVDLEKLQHGILNNVMIRKKIVSKDKVM